jgi:hypothetical protein
MLVAIFMDIQQFITSLGFFTIGSISLTAVIGFVAKSIFNKYLDKNIEMFRFKLQQENEKFRFELQRQNAEYQIKFEALHKDRAEVIKQLHNQLTTMRYQLISFNIDSELQKLPIEENPVLKKYKELEIFFEKNKLYFSKTICEKVTNFMSKFLASAAISAYLSKNRDKIKFIRKDDPEQKEIPQKNLFNLLDDSNILSDLENEFRDLIGVQK